MKKFFRNLYRKVSSHLLKKLYRKNLHYVYCKILFTAITEKKLYDHFLWIGFNCLKAAESLRGNNLLLITKSAGNPGTHLLNFGEMKG